MERKNVGNNYLLVKGEVGKPKQSIHNLPPDGFAFGRPDKKDNEGAGLVTSTWRPHELSKAGEPEKDFKKLNKYGLKQGAVNPKVISWFMIRNKKIIEDQLT